MAVACASPSVILYAMLAASRLGKMNTSVHGKPGQAGPHQLGRGADPLHGGMIGASLGAEGQHG